MICISKVQLWIIIGVASVVVIGLAIALPLTLGGDDDPEESTENFIGRMVLDEVPLVDGHNDLPMNLYDHERNQINDFDFEADLTQHPGWGTSPYSYTDLQRLRQGKLGGQFWVSWTDCDTTQYKDAVEHTLEQIDVTKRLIAKYPDYMQYTTTAQGILDAFEDGKIASMIGVEGGHSIDSRLAVLRMYYELGVRYMTLTHTCNVPWADASPIDIDETAVKKNLTEFGKVVVLEMNRLGMMVDLSHVSHGVMDTVLEISRAPIIFSHSNSFTVQDHHRNVRDDILERLPANGGIIMVNFYQVFVGGSSMLDVVAHLNHIKSVTGPDHIGIGADYDGIDSPVVGLEDVSKYPELFDLLAESGHGYEPWTREELKKLAGLNLIRVFQEVERVRDELKSELPYEDIIPSEILLAANEQTCRTDVPTWIGSSVLDQVPLIDGHNDLPFNFYMMEQNQINDFDFDSDLLQHPVWGPADNSFTDLPRLRKGKVGGQFWVAYVRCVNTQYKDAVEQTLDQIDVIKRLVRKYKNDMAFVISARGIWDAYRENKIASLIGVEGGHSIDSRLSVLRMFYDLGVRYMTLTHSCNQPWIDASPIDELEVDKRNLTEWGEMVIDEMNRLGMLIDLSHVSYGVMHAVLDRTTAPVIFSHSSSYTVFPHHRNVQDDVLEKLAKNGGIIMVNFYSGFIGDGNPTIMDVISHLNHIKSITGSDHIGLGGDYDGVDRVPTGLEDVSKYPDLFDLLAEPGHGYKPWTMDELKKLAGLNLIRVFEEVEKVRDNLENEPPIEHLIPDADLYEAANQTCRSNFNYSPESEVNSRAYYFDELISAGC